MSDAQINAFRAAGMMEPRDLSQLMLALFCAAFSLWCSWVLVSAWRGVVSHRISWRELGGIAARTLLLMLTSFWLVLG